MKNVKNPRDIDFITNKRRRKYLVSEVTHHTIFFWKFTSHRIEKNKQTNKQNNNNKK